MVVVEYKLSLQIKLLVNKLQQKSNSRSNSTLKQNGHISATIYTSLMCRNFLLKWGKHWKKMH